jgi:uncharacterized protein (TIGR03067 family)
MRAPDTAAGKKIKCPKCQGAIVVPAAHADFEVVEDEPAAPAKKPGFGSGAAKSPLGSGAGKAPVKADVEVVKDEKPQKRVKTDVEVDDEDEDEKPKKKRAKAVAEEEDEDDRPRKKKRKTEDDEDEEEEKPRKKKVAAEEEDEEKPRKKKRTEEDEDDEDEKPKKKKKRGADEGGSSMVRNIIGGVVLLILLGVVGFVYYERFGKKDKEETASTPKTDAPSGPPGGFPGPKLPGGGPRPNSPDQELKRFQGSWQMVSVTVNGQTVTGDKLKGKVWRFDVDRVTPMDNKNDDATIALDPTKTPATIDIKDRAGEVIQGIYKFTGEDKITICSRSDNKRPQAFDASKGSSATVLELERIKTK